MPITFKRDGLKRRLSRYPIEGMDTDAWDGLQDCDVEDVQAVLEAHPEIAEKAGYVKRDRCKEATLVRNGVDGCVEAIVKFGPGDSVCIELPTGMASETLDSAIERGDVVTKISGSLPHPASVHYVRNVLAAQNAELRRAAESVVHHASTDEALATTQSLDAWWVVTRSEALEALEDAVMADPTDAARRVELLELYWHASNTPPAHRQDVDIKGVIEELRALDTGEDQEGLS